MCEDSKIVPTLTVNFFRHCEHFQSPRCVRVFVVAFGVRLYMAEPKLVPQTRTSLAKLRRLVDTVPEPLRPALRFQIWRILPHASVIPQTFFLTITNPGAILGLFAIFGGLGSVIGGFKNYFEAMTVVVSAGFAAARFSPFETPCRALRP